MYDAERLPEVFAQLQPQPADELLSLIALYRDDPRPGKIDLGVGVYQDACGRTPVFAAVKAAERALLRDQSTKAYLGPEGDVGFLEHVAPIVFGDTVRLTDLVSAQTPGGTGALRVAAELVAAGRPEARVWLGVPSWPVHAGLFRRAGLDVRLVPYFDPDSQTVRFDGFLETISDASPGDVVILHGACHNPTGADLSLDQWARLAEVMEARGVVPIVDLAYQGLGDGLDEDAAGLRLLMGRCETVIVAHSCDKSFGLYRERTGALFIRTAQSARDVVRSNMLQRGRFAWSMPPDHGAAVVRIILEADALRSLWDAELSGMRDRLKAMRAALADAVPRLGSLRRQRGLFALLPVSGEAVQALRRDHAVYLASSGRINLSGLNADTIPVFVRALDAVL